MRKKFLLSFLGVILMTLMLVLTGCGDNGEEPVVEEKTVKLVLPDGVVLSDESLDPNKLKLNSEIELLIIPPEGQELNTLLINGQDMSYLVCEGMIVIPVLEGLTIAVSFKDIPPQTTRINLPNEITLVDSSLDVNALVVGTNVEMLITPPKGRELDTLLINGENKTSTVVDNKFTVNIKDSLNIAVTFKYKVIAINLPDGVVPVDESVDVNHVSITSNIELKVVVPTGKGLASLKVNGDELVDDLGEDKKFNVTVSEDLTIEVEFGMIRYITYSVNDGLFTFQQEVIENGIVKDDYVLEEAGNLEWKLNGEPFEFGQIYSYSKDITLTTTVNPIDESKIISYSISGVVSIFGIDPAGAKIIIIPSTFQGYPVQSIKGAQHNRSVFTTRDVVKYVQILDGPQTIGEHAFFCERQLKEVVLPDSLTTIGNHSFAESSIRKIEIPSSVKVIGEHAFIHCDHLQEVIFKDEINSKLETIGGGAFAQTGLTSFKIVNDADLDALIFNGTNIKVIELSEGSTKYFVDEHNVLYSFDKETLILYPHGKEDTSYSVLEGTKYLDNGSLASSVNLIELTLPTSLLEIRNDALTGLVNLEILNIPDDCELKTIGWHVLRGNDKIKTFKITSKVETIDMMYGFYEFNSLEEFIVLEDNQNFKSIDGVLYSKDETRLFLSPIAKTGSHTVSANTKIIENRAFSNSKLDEIILQEGLEYIGTAAFHGALNLSYLVIPGSVTYISYNICSILNVFIEATSRPSGWYPSFGHDLQLHYRPNWEYDENGIPHYFPVDISNLPEGISLVNERVDPTAAPIGCELAFQIDIPQGQKVGKLLANDIDITSLVAGDKFIYPIPAEGLILSYTLENITYTLTYSINYGGIIIEQPVTHNQVIENTFILEETGIEYWVYGNAPFAFGNPYNYLGDITINTVVNPLNIENITFEVVENKAIITKINNPAGTKVLVLPNYYQAYPIDSIADLDDSVLTNKNVVRHLQLPKFMTKIGNKAFFGENELRTTSIPNGLISIGNLAFSDTALKKFELVNDLNIIGKGVFLGCENLERIEIISNSTRYKVIDDVLFSLDGTVLIYYPNPKQETMYTIPDGVETIDYDALKDKNFESLVVPESVTTIGKSAFSTSPSKVKVYFETTEAKAGFDANWSDGTLEFYYAPYWEFNLDGIPQVIDQLLWREITIKHMGEDLDGNYTIILNTKTVGGIVGKDINILEKSFDHYSFDPDNTLTYTVTDEVTQEVEIRYLRNKHTITFNPNGANTTPSPMENIYYDQTVTLSFDSEPTITGYTLVGWTIDDTDELFETGYKMPDRDITLKAKWQINTYRIRFNGNGALEVTMEDQIATYNQSIKLSKNTYVKEGFEFKGWALNETGTVVHTDEKIVTNLAESGEITLYAVWKLYSKITLNLNGGELPSGYNEITYLQDSDFPYTLPIPTKAIVGDTGYEFLGFYNQDSIFGTGTKYEQLTTPNDYTLYAIWVELYYSTKEYPQTRVTNQALISALNGEPVVTSSQHVYTSQLSLNTEVWHTVTYQGNKYEKVGSDYFKYEPIVFYKIPNDVNYSYVTLCSKYILDFSPFDEIKSGATTNVFDYSYVKAYLNSVFAVKAGLDETNAISLMTAWFFVHNPYFTNDDRRKAESTDYAQAVMSGARGEFSFWVRYHPYNHYWTRDSVENSYSVHIVTHAGNMARIGPDYFYGLRIWGRAI